MRGTLSHSCRLKCCTRSFCENVARAVFSQLFSVFLQFFAVFSQFFCNFWASIDKNVARAVFPQFFAVFSQFFCNFRVSVEMLHSQFFRSFSQFFRSFFAVFSQFCCNFLSVSEQMLHCWSDRWWGDGCVRSRSCRGSASRVGQCVLRPSLPNRSWSGPAGSIFLSRIIRRLECRLHVATFEAVTLAAASATKHLSDVAQHHILSHALVSFSLLLLDIAIGRPPPRTATNA